MFTLIKDGTIYTPKLIGKKDILLVGSTIAHIADTINLPEDFGGQIISADGKNVAPGFVDLHVHLAGGGGETPKARTPEIQLSSIINAGVTTVIGCLGTDNVTRTPENLLAKAVQLDLEGISTYIYTGSYQVPLTTITGSARKDIALIPKIIGVGELAISDHRSSQPTYEELCRIAAEARVGGMIGGKAGIVHLHVGNGKAGLDTIIRIAQDTEIPIDQFLPTHVNRNERLFTQAIEFAKLGGNIDITAESSESTSRKPVSEAISLALESGVGLEQMTISSDSNGSMPTFNEQGRLVGMAVGDIRNLYKQWIKLVHAGFSLENALTFITSNPAKRTGIFATKGSLEIGKDADLLIFDENLSLDSVIAKGRLMAQHGEVLVKGTFES
ncbi:beta-aspartyl-peptidase [candidate division KSB3 bacterium]|uniref:Isoaspartyl dipeptidase n=1 Tax=candidate division KSB3 bacterium TaxID=2044937 RepID=A0A2G6KM36_9BACT|nr:MAG: beta-aspartyl-peptidase [candidate division KSB3 bacterium]